MSAIEGRLRVGVVGAGGAGRALAGAFARAGAAVAVYDPDPDRVSVVAYRIALELEAIGADPAAADNVVPVASLAAVAAADLVLEAAPEDLALKRALCSTLGTLAPAAAILATVTSTLPVAEIAVAAIRPDRFLGVRRRPPSGAYRAGWESLPGAVRVGSEPSGIEPIELIAAEMTDPAVLDHAARLLDAAFAGRPVGGGSQSFGWITNASPARHSGVSSTSAKRQPSAVRTQRQS